ncbi:MAG: hypothetical protein RBT81_02155 [Gammaproteobacteria bacterium]|jgi:hypothetical protein|nr:hypothetical protein [Gammaproteobacteria bacterium]
MLCSSVRFLWAGLGKACGLGLENLWISFALVPHQLEIRRPDMHIRREKRRKDESAGFNVPVGDALTAAPLLSSRFLSELKKKDPR